MKPILVSAFALLLAAPTSISAETENFDGAKPGALPANWLGTKTGSGSVGLWTKADSVTAFDDFSYGPLP